MDPAKNYIFTHNNDIVRWGSDGLSPHLAANGYHQAIYDFADFQYIRVDSVLTIKAQISQSAIVDPGTSPAPIDYAVLNQDNKNYFFFVNSVRQISQTTLELQLELDVLNTFDFIYSMTEKTHITREHKNRFTKSDGILTPVYDKFDEGFTPQLIRTHATRLDGDHPYGHFYLMYMKDNVMNPPNTELTCHLTADFDVYFNVGNTPLRLRRIDEWDRRMQELQKIIELPYAPFQYPVNGSRGLTPQTAISVPAGWDAAAYVTPAITCAVWLKSLDGRLANTFLHGLHGTPIGPDYHRRKPGEFQSAFQYDDPKLYTSAFYQYKIVYDSWAWQAPIEDLVVVSQCSGGNDMGPDLSITFVASNTMNSKFGFVFSISPSTGADDDEGVGVYRFRYDTDFGEYMIVSRNNELPIYNDEYLNYIKSGYNYDKKVKAQQEQAAAVNTAATIVGSVLSTITIALAASGVGAPIAAATGAVGAMGLSLYNLQNQISLNNQSLDQKLNMLSKQSIGVSGVDDVSLLKWYSGDKLVEVEYRVRDDVRKMLNQLFHYFGYRCDYYGVPNVDTRLYFNFLQCEPDFDFFHFPAVGASAGLTQEFATIAKEKFKQGVTIFHYRYTMSADDYFVAAYQQYENWENDLL